ncbi:MAG: hypothetical protein LBC93_05255 [Synergistaceae bacterium]|jgi:uncharacterized protein YgbK (DUF1537 family)|nr:hypothetical protein [Synergistaceae bacterium]
MFEYVIVADDYTGAVETASKFTNGGYRAVIALDSDSLGVSRSCEVVALNTETILSLPGEAERRLSAVARSLLPWKGSVVFFKRVDAALRGNVGLEVRAIARELEPDLIVAAPGLSRGRQALEEGMTYMEPQDAPPPEEAELERREPASLTATAEALRREGFHPVEVGLDDIRNRKVAEFAARKGCLCFGAEVDEDFKAIVQGVLQTAQAKNVLWVGNVGLAEALAMTPRPFVVVVGTAHPRSIRQARQLLDHAAAHPVQIDAGTLRDGASLGLEAERTRVVEEAENLLRCGQPVLLAATMDGRFVQGGYPGGSLDGFLSFIADTVRDIMGRVRIGGLCVTGGDCAARIARKARAESVSVVEEIQEGITLSRLNGGPFHDLPLVTKSGALGGDRALLHCMEFLTGQTRAQTL